MIQSLQSISISKLTPIQIRLQPQHGKSHMVSENKEKRKESPHLIWWQQETASALHFISITVIPFSMDMCTIKETSLFIFSRFRASFYHEARLETGNTFKCSNSFFLKKKHTMQPYSTNTNTQYRIYLCYVGFTWRGEIKKGDEEDNLTFDLPSII